MLQVSTHQIFLILQIKNFSRSMRIGKVLVDSDSETHEAHVVFAKFPDDIASRKVLLLYPIMR